MESLPQMLERNARLIGNQVFVHFEGQDLTYAELDAAARRLARVLRNRGARKGDRIGILLPNGLDAVVSYWAVQVLGAVAVPIAPMLRVAEVHHIVKQAGIDIIFVDEETESVGRKAAENGLVVSTILDFSPNASGDALRAEIARADPVTETWFADRADLANIFFTSGTTGVPKGAMQTHFCQYSTVRDMMVFNGWRFAEPVCYCALPLTNNMGCTVLMNLTMFAGGKLVLDKRWDTKRAMAAIRDHKISYVLGPPTIFVYMVSEFDPETDDLSSLRLCLVGGAPVPTEVLTRFEALAGARIVQAYGATEVTGGVAIDPIVGTRKLGSAGLPIGSSRLEIVDDDGRELPAGELGEIRVQGDTVGAGYWGDAEASAKSFTARGWLSGDIGRLDEDGYLYVVDRKKDLIISGGFNIYPIELENLLYSHPDIRLCAVIGIPDAHKGEVAVAVIVPRAIPPQAEEIIAYCREHIAAYKVPRRIFFVDEIPTNPVGKVLKRELRALLAAGELSEWKDGVHT